MLRNTLIALSIVVAGAFAMTTVPPALYAAEAAKAADVDKDSVHLTAHGVIRNIDKDNKSFTLLLDDQKPLTLLYDDKTKFMDNAKEGDAAILKVGSKADVTYHDNLALKVVIGVVGSDLKPAE